MAAVIYGLGLVALFAGSALYHRWRWDPRWRPLLRRMDHSTIFVFIAASYTPVGLVVLDWTCAAVGVWLGALPASPSAWPGSMRRAGCRRPCTSALGWVAAIAGPDLATASAAPLILIVVGGVLYTTGAVIYALRRPDPGR